ncbi:MAG TPA: hypothetical protein VGQ30_06410 [Gemmatimonadaceae bacterium]|jgi:hypothetical protein|nr:hypothetical protein [Gemmatimonadaceae bacterium]
MHRHWNRIAAVILALTPLAAFPQDRTEPRPDSAVAAVLAAFGRFPVVALGMQHQQQDEADFSLRLIRSPGFAAAVNDIVIECGNPLYQRVLDRYIARESVDAEQLSQVWRNTTQPGRCEPRQHRELLDAVRELNRQLPRARKLRVLAGDSPIDWAVVRTSADVQRFLNARDSAFASVVNEQVLAKHRKALLVIGAAHIMRQPITWRAEPTPAAITATGIIERAHPHTTFVIVPHDGFGNQLPAYEARMAAWPKPSLVLLRGTWLGAVSGKTIFADNVRRVGGDPKVFDDPYFGFNLEDLADAYLYLGPLASLTSVQWPDISGTAYGKEVERRNGLIGMRAGPAPLRVPR